MNGSPIKMHYLKKLRTFLGGRFLVDVFWGTMFKVEVYVRKLNADNNGRIHARFHLYDEANSDFSDYQRLTDPIYEEQTTLEAE